MSRLPVVGQDDDIWGDVLNDFLSVEHNADGTLKRAAIDSAVVHKAGSETITGTKTFSVSPVVPNPTGSTQAANKNYVDTVVAGGAADATTTTKGIVQLAGDLSGTATAPTVPGLTGKEDTITAGTTSQYWRGDKSWQTLDKTAVGLSNVDNTSDANKPVSTATQTALNTKADKTTLTTKGDIYAATAASTPVRLGVGTDGQVLTAASAQATGLSWTTLTAAGVGAIPTSEKGAANGVAQLDGSGKVNPGQLQTSNITKVLPYSYLGNLVVSTGTFRLYNDTGSTWTISGVRASVGTAPAGASIIIDISKNGTTIFTTQANRPTIAAATNTSGNVTTMDVTTVAAGEYLTVDIDQIGSTTAGADLTVQVEVY